MNISVENNTTLSSEYLQVQYVLYTGADSIHLILGFPTNFYVLWLIVTGEKGTVDSDFFALNLAMSDMLTCVSSLMFILHNNIFSPNLESGPLWNTAIFFNGFIIAGRPLFQSCICLERYFAVVYPVFFLMYRSLIYRFCCAGVVWVLVLGCCLAYWYKSTNTLNDFTLCLMLVTCSVMLFCCLSVLRVLKRPKPGDAQAYGEGTKNMKLTAFRIILAIMVSMIVMYLPLTVLMIMYHLIDTVKFNFGMPICFSFLIVTGFVQPLLYLHRVGRLPCIKGP